MSKQKNIKVRLRLVIIKNNKLLATYDSVDNYFFYVGGKLEFGETVKNGCQREVTEECGSWAKFVFKKNAALVGFRERNSAAGAVGVQDYCLPGAL